MDVYVYEDTAGNLHFLTNTRQAMAYENWEFKGKTKIALFDEDGKEKGNEG